MQNLDDIILNAHLRGPCNVCTVCTSEIIEDRTAIISDATYGIPVEGDFPLYEVI